MDTSTNETELIVSLPLVPVKRTVLFPETLVPFTIGRARSMAAVEAAMNTEEKALLMVTQRDSEKEEPGFDDLFLIGTKAVLKQMGKTSEGHLQVLACLFFDALVSQLTARCPLRAIPSPCRYIRASLYCASASPR